MGFAAVEPARQRCQHPGHQQKTAPVSRPGRLLGNPPGKRPRPVAVQFTCQDGHEVNHGAGRVFPRSRSTLDDPFRQLKGPRGVESGDQLSQRFGEFATRSPVRQSARGVPPGMPDHLIGQGRHELATQGEIGLAGKEIKKVC